MTNIFITGDSWGVKEWTPHNANENAEAIDRTAHRGLHTYFEEEEFKVHNLSSGGSSNGESIDRLINYFDQEFHIYSNSTDYIFWILTDPIRDLRPYHNPNKKLSYELAVNNGWNNLIKKSFHEQCARANELAQKRNIKINLIGGILSFTANDVKSYTNLIPCIPSWYDMLLSSVEKKMIPNRPIWTSQTSDVHITDIDLEYIEKIAGKDLAKLIVNEFWEINEFHRIVHDTNKFFTLDHSHPDRYGHKLLFDRIWENLKIQ